MVTCQAENVFGTRVAQVKLIVFGEFVFFILLPGDINKAIALYCTLERNRMLCKMSNTVKMEITVYDGTTKKSV